MSSEFIAEFKDLLAQLKRNEKRDINVLSMLAEDNKQYASFIVEAIEKHILVVRAAARPGVLRRPTLGRCTNATLLMLVCCLWAWCCCCSCFS
jgi:hypothetical protein